MKRFVLLDRDGVLNEERRYLSDPDELVLLPGVLEGLQRLRDAGLGLVVVTNQSAIGRGYFDERRLAEIHERLRELLSAGGVRLDDILHCPHTPDDDCRCRKPLPGMAEQAAERWGFALDQAFLVGDKASDIDLGRAVGATTFLVRTGYGRQYEQSGECRPDHVVDSLTDVADRILEEPFTSG